MTMAKNDEPIDRPDQLHAKLSIIATALTSEKEAGEFGGKAKEGLMFLLYDLSDEAGEISGVLSGGEA
jgi:hypothetical protein